jgi:hypothetical protein
MYTYGFGDGWEMDRIPELYIVDFRFHL